MADPTAPGPDAVEGSADKPVPRPGDGPAEDPPGPASLAANDAAPGSQAEAEAGAAVEIEAVEGAAAEVAEGPPDADDARPAAPKSAAMMVAAGILSSRVLGLVRERAQGYFFGLGPHADVLRVALKTPNFLQNLLGEGTISAAFIPIYSRMLEEGREEDAGRFAGAVFGLLLALVSVVVGLGVLLARPLLTVLLAGWAGDAAEVAAGHLAVNRFELAVATVKLTFPMAGVLVLSAWALGVLNSHRRFFLPYVAPVLWNVAIIGGLVLGGLSLPAGSTLDALPTGMLDRLLFAALTGALVGGGLQFAVQLPTVLRLLRGFRPSLSLNVEGVRASIRAFVPVVLGRGAYQLSGYLDTFLAGFLAAGAVSSYNNALVLYVLPVSLFGMSVAASELPELSRISTSELSGFLDRVGGSLRQILYLIVPTVVGYLLFGDLVVGALYQTGAFGRAETWMVALVLMSLTLGLVATTATRLLQNAFYALRDTRTPARIATTRLAVSALIGAGLMLLFERYTLGQVPGLADAVPTGGGAPLRLGAVGLALGSALGAWLEQAQLVRALRRHAPTFHLPARRTLQMMALALAAAVPAGFLRLVLPDGLPVLLRSALVLGVYGLGYLALGHRLGFTEGEAWVGRLLRRRKR